jgi:hypothetical protein
MTIAMTTNVYGRRNAMRTMPSIAELFPCPSPERF